MAALAEPEEVRAHLVGAARTRTSITYSALLERLGYGFSRPKMRQLCAILGAVDEMAAARGEPLLALLVVRQSDGLPGQGWWVAGGARAHGYSGPWEGPEARRFISALQAETFDYWQSENETGAAGRAD